ncbi:MAG: MFS transporter [Bacilli bacterium]
MKKNNPYVYALILLSLTLISQMFTNYNYSYFVDDMALITLKQASLAKMIFIVFDGVNDIIFGILSDKTKHRNIPRSKWMICTLPFYCFALIFTYAINKNVQLSNIQFFFYYIIVTILFDVFSSIMFVNYNALFTNLYKQEQERNKVSSLTHIFEILGIGIIFIIGPILKENIGYLKTSYLISVIVIIIFYICFSLIEEKEESVNKEKESFSFKDVLKALYKNKEFVSYILTTSSFLTILGTLVTILPFIVKYILKINAYQQVILTVVACFLILFSIKLFSLLINKYGLRKIYKISFIIFPILVILLSLSFSFYSALIFIILCCPFLGGFFIFPDLIISRIIDKEKKNHGQCITGFILSVSSFTRRLALLLGSFILFLVSLLFNYIDGENPGNNPELCFRIITSLFLPFIALCGTLSSKIYLNSTSK